MAFLPDTNVWISLLKHPRGNLEAKLRSQPVADILLCAVVKAELWHGAVMEAGMLTAPPGPM